MDSKANPAPEARDDLFQTPSIVRGHRGSTRGRLTALTRCASTPNNDELRALIDFDAEHSLRKSPRRTRVKTVSGDDNGHDLSQDQDDSGVHSWEHSESPSASHSRFELGLSSSLESSAEFDFHSSVSGYSSLTSSSSDSLNGHNGTRPKTKLNPVRLKDRDLCYTDGSALLEITAESSELTKRFSYTPGLFLGKPCVDFIKNFCERGMDRIIVHRILRELSPRDLCAVLSVSQVWREAVIFNPEANKRREEFVTAKKLNQENGSKEFSFRRCSPRKAMSNVSNLLTLSPTYAKREREEQNEPKIVSPSKIRHQLFYERSVKIESW